MSARVACFLWLPVAVYLALTLTRGLNIGHRHLLPIYPFLFVAAGRATLVRGWRPLSVAVVAAAVWYAVSVARVHPHYLAYFNEAAGGPAHGYRLLADLNLDWGQDLKRLPERLVRAHGIDRAKLCTSAPPIPSTTTCPPTCCPVTCCRVRARRSAASCPATSWR